MATAAAAASAVASTLSISSLFSGHLFPEASSIDRPIVQFQHSLYNGRLAQADRLPNWPTAWILLALSIVRPRSIFVLSGCCCCCRWDEGKRESDTFSVALGAHAHTHCTNLSIVCVFLLIITWLVVVLLLLFTGLYSPSLGRHCWHANWQALQPSRHTHADMHRVLLSFFLSFFLTGISISGTNLGTVGFCLLKHHHHPLFRFLFHHHQLLLLFLFLLISALHHWPFRAVPTDGQASESFISQPRPINEYDLFVRQMATCEKIAKKGLAAHHLACCKATFFILSQS